MQARGSITAMVWNDYIRRRKFHSLYEASHVELSDFARGWPVCQVAGAGEGTTELEDEKGR